MKTVHILLMLASVMPLSGSTTKSFIDGHHYYLAVRDDATNNTVEIHAGNLPIVQETQEEACTYVAATLEENADSYKLTAYIQGLLHLYNAGALPYAELMHLLSHPDFQDGYATHHLILVDETDRLYDVIDATALPEEDPATQAAILDSIKAALCQRPTPPTKEFMLGVHDLYCAGHLPASACLDLALPEGTVCSAHHNKDTTADLLADESVVAAH